MEVYVCLNIYPWMYACMYVCIKRQNGKDQGYNIVERKVLRKKIETERLEIHPFYLHQWDGGVLGSQF